MMFLMFGNMTLFSVRNVKRNRGAEKTQFLLFFLSDNLGVFATTIVNEKKKTLK